MRDVDPGGEWRELAERYHRMTDEEVVLLAQQRSNLTDIAHQALTQEIAYRGIEAPPDTAAVKGPLSPRISVEREAESKPEFELEEDPDSPYAQERRFVDLRTVWSLRDAIQLEFVLDRAGIPFVMGSEKATGVEEVTSDFSKGIVVQVMSIGMTWAIQAMKNYLSQDEPTPEAEEELEDIPVQCPKCRSTDVVLLNTDGTASHVANDFNWTCDVCHHQWQDDGIVNN
jgi:hypothetical protein